MNNIYNVLNLDNENTLKLESILIKLKHLDKTKYDDWIKSVSVLLKQYKEKYNLSDINVFENSRLGIIFSAKSNMGDIVIKIIFF